MSCCTSRRTAHSSVKDFCSSLKFHTIVFLSSGTYAIHLMVKLPNKKETRLDEAMKAYGCQAGSTSGTRLASLVLEAWDRALSMDVDVEEELKRLLGGRSPTAGVQLLRMKEALYELVGTCEKCKGRGCALCGKTGLKPQG